MGKKGKKRKEIDSRWRGGKVRKRRNGEEQIDEI